MYLLRRLIDAADGDQAKVDFSLSVLSWDSPDRAANIQRMAQSLNLPDEWGHLCYVVDFLLSHRAELLLKAKDGSLSQGEAQCTRDGAEFKSAAKKLLEGTSPEAWRLATGKMDQLFRENANGDYLAFGQMSTLKETLGGYAILPSLAANCLKDSIRTAGFAKGLFDAINVAKKTFTERPIRILYAGCGPFATLAMIVAPFFEKGEVEFTALDVYEASVACANKVAKNLGQADKFKEIKWGDATNYKVKGKRPHIIITETMQSQLLTEPQPQITAELGDQLEDGGIFIPQLVDVNAFAGRTEYSGIRHDPFVSDLEPIGELFKLTPELARLVKDGNGQINMARLTQALTVNKTLPISDRAAELPQLIIQTRVHIFGNEWLTGNTPTGITRRIINELRIFGLVPAQIRFSYIAGQSDDIEVEITDKRENKSNIRLRNLRKGD